VRVKEEKLWKFVDCMVDPSSIYSTSLSNQAVRSGSVFDLCSDNGQCSNYILSFPSRFRVVFFELTTYAGGHLMHKQLIRTGPIFTLYVRFALTITPQSFDFHLSWTHFWYIWMSRTVQGIGGMAMYDKDCVGWA
jgi:hypothetical protein